MNVDGYALVFFAYTGLFLFILLGYGLWVFGEAKDIYVKATERLHRRKMEAFDKLITLEKARCTDQAAGNAETPPTPDENDPLDKPLVQPNYEI